MLTTIWAWLSDPANWQGEDGVPQRTLEHLEYTAITLVIASLIAIPLGLYIGHTGRGKLFIVNVAGAIRSIPTLGLLFVATLLLAPRLKGDNAYLVPSIIVLVVLAVPPILSGAYAGVDEVDPAARDAARGMGMTGWQVLRKVEVPCAMPLIFSGMRSATLQVIATATIAATVSLGGLGRLLIDGLSIQDYGKVASGAILVAALALLADLAFALAQRYAVSPGLTGRFRVKAAVGDDSRSALIDPAVHEAA
ncbi:ABC transporter permease [Oryzihumus sp.]|uniref:ABC transporter permease n=1 Tax=Oryzihumus sp. TaxID=1968903 RepID=UPI002ED81AE7